MTVKELMLILAEQPEDAEVFVEAQGYHNYDHKTGTYREDETTGIAKHNGKLFICADSAMITDY